MKNLKRKFEIVLCLAVLVPVMALAILFASLALWFGAQHYFLNNDFPSQPNSNVLWILTVVILVPVVYFFVAYVSRDDPAYKRKIETVLNLATLIPILAFTALFAIGMGPSAYREHRGQWNRLKISPPAAVQSMPAPAPEPRKPCDPWYEVDPCIQDMKDTYDVVNF